MNDDENIQSDGNVQINDNLNNIGQEQSSSSGNPVSNFIKDPINTLKNSIGNFWSKRKKRSRSFFVRIWSRIPLKFKIILLIIVSMVVLVVCVLEAKNLLNSKTAVNTRNDAVQSIGIYNQGNSSTGDIQNSSQTELTTIEQAAIDLYNNYDSLIGFTTDQLNQIYNSFLANDSKENEYLLGSASDLFGSESADKFSYNYKRSLYEHILRTEKYNFNKIVWKGYSHTQDNYDLETETRENLELIVPKGIDDETLVTLLKTASPYLLTQDIPLGFLCGMESQSNTSASSRTSLAQDFVYQIFKEALTKITINRYELETLKYQTTQEKFNYNTYTQSYYVNVYSNGYEELVREDEPELISTTDPELSAETKIQGTDQYTYDIYWYPSEAITYDAKITNDFELTKYSDSDAQSIRNPDSNTLISTVELDELHEVKSEKTINNAGSKPLKADGTPEAPVNSNVKRTYEYVKKEGYTYTYEKEWKDKLTPESSDYEVFGYNTALEYHTTTDSKYTNYETDKSLISKEKFEQDNPSGESIFDSYTEEDSSEKLYGMSIIDLMDSNSGIYDMYLSSGENISEYEGIGRYKLKSAYTQVKTVLNSLVSKIDNNGDSSKYQFSSVVDTTDKTLPFVYGSTLGYNVTKISYNSSSSSSSLSGMNLLKAYLRQNEGHEGVADENGNRMANSMVDQATYYIVGEVPTGKEGEYTRTVGYGIDLDKSGYEAELMAAVGRTTPFEVGDLIPIELVDKCEENEISKAIAAVEAEFAGIELKEYQIHALVSRYYNCGASGWKWEKYSESGKTIVQAYNTWWNEEEDDQYESLYEQFKDNETAVSEIVSKADYSNGLYTDIMSNPINDGILVSRRQSEWILFSMGYYDSLQRFWSNSSGSPGGIDLYNSDGTINEEACAELTNWFVDNFFSGDARMRFTGMGGWDKTSVNSLGVKLNTSEYPFLNNGLSVYQCTWWARVRATYQAWMMDPDNLDNYIRTSGNGCMVAKNTASYYHVNLNNNVENIKPNSIVSFNEFTADYPVEGHVAYVEAVDYENRVFYISHCGGGNSWYGITKKTFDSYSGSNSSKFGGSVSIEDIVNSDVYKGGNG